MSVLDPRVAGWWSPLFCLPNVAVHVSLLPDGTVLSWGRRDRLDGGMDEHECTPWIWNPADDSIRFTPQPLDLDGGKINLFCSGHAFLPNGQLLVAGGHLRDGVGLDQATCFDWKTGRWSALPKMNKGRWYPSVTVLPDGSLLVSSGSANNKNNCIPQIWDGKAWSAVPKQVLSLYPRLVVLPNGDVFVAGTDPTGAILHLAGGAAWSPGPSRAGGNREYAPAVCYSPGKIIFIGGGNAAEAPKVPSAATEKIDFTVAKPAWTAAASMHFPRRQHNGTLLPDGTVLVTGGTRGGGFDGGFNDLSPGAPVHEAELWDPATNLWSVLAAEDKDRCYHSTAILLPDGRVLSAGGGEYGANGGPLPLEHVHHDGQIFSPPYLFRGPRPEIVSDVQEVKYGGQFDLGLRGAPATNIRAMRPGSVTHSLDANQRLVELKFDQRGSTARVTAPGDPNMFPPGYWMVFALSARGVPSHAHFLRIAPEPATVAKLSAARASAPRAAAAAVVAPALQGAKVEIGLTSRCPYGLAACWGGAYQGLHRLSRVLAVNPTPNAASSTAEVYLAEGELPDLAVWPDEFKAVVHGSYDFRGVEMTLEGALQERDGGLQLEYGASPVQLAPLTHDVKIQWDWSTRARAARSSDETSAYERLVAQHRAGTARVRVTGPLRLSDGRYVLSVRQFDSIPAVAP